MNSKQEVAEQQLETVLADSLATRAIEEAVEQKQAEESSRLLKMLDDSDDHNDHDRTCYCCFDEVQWSTVVIVFSPCNHWICPTVKRNCPIPQICGLCQRTVLAVSRQTRGSI